MGRGIREYLKATLPANVHLPAKPEATLLRKLKKETGMTEEEIRSVKKYRVMLSATQKKKKARYNEFEKDFLSIVKEATKELKLPKEHPDVLNKVIEIVGKSYRNMKFNYGISNYNYPTTAKGVLEMIKILHVPKNVKNRKK